MINYLTPSGNNLTYPLKQVTVNIDKADLKTLNTSPYQLVPLGNYISVVNVTLKYDNVVLNTAFSLFVGFEAILTSAVPDSYCLFQPGNMSGNRGVISLGTVDFNNNLENNLNSQPLVLWQTNDDAIANYNSFQITVTYLEFT